MKRFSIETQIMAAIFIVSIILLGIAVFFLSKNTPTAIDPNKEYSIDLSKGQKIGSESAKVKLIEFSDFQCPACASTNPFIKQVIQEYSDRVQFIHRNFPLPQHLNAPAAANAAQEAAAQGKFWDYHNRLFETQNDWAGLANPIEHFAKLGQELGLDSAKITEAVKQNKYKSVIDADLNEGGSIGVNSTPTFFLNNRRLIISDYESFKNAIDEAIKNNN